MAESGPEKKDWGGDAACLMCGSNSQQRVLIPCLVKGEEKWVCVRCLPAVIHSGH